MRHYIKHGTPSPQTSPALQDPTSLTGQVARPAQRVPVPERTLHRSERRFGRVAKAILIRAARCPDRAVMGGRQRMVRLGLTRRNRAVNEASAAERPASCAGIHRVGGRTAG